MRKFNTPARVVLADENHRINRRAMLMDMIEETLQLRSQEDNWILRDRYTDDLCKIEEALDELERENPKRDEETAKEYYERLGKMLSAKIKEIKGRRKSALKEQQDAAKREARERRQSRRQEGYSGDPTDDDDD